MGQLLCYLMQHADKDVITDDDILRNVWEKNGLSGTHSRLWQVMQSLNKKLNKIGVKSDLFMRVRGKGYSVIDGKIVPLYTRAEKQKKIMSQTSSERQSGSRGFL